MATSTGWSIREYMYFFGFLSFCGFLVGITNLASMVAKCKESTSFATVGNFSGNNRQIIQQTAYFSIYGTQNCGYAYEFQWWTLVLNFTVLLVVLFAEMFGYTRRARGASIGLLSIAIVMLMIDINSWLGQIRNLGTGPNLRRSARGALVGWIMLAVGNFLVLMLVGYDLSPDIPAKGYSRVADPNAAPPDDDVEMNPADALAKEKGKDKK